MRVVPNEYRIKIRRKGALSNGVYVWTVTHFGDEVASGESKAEFWARLDAMEQVVHDLGAAAIWDIGSRA